MRLAWLGECGLPVRDGRGWGCGEAAGRCLGQQETREGCCAVLRTHLKPESEVRTALCPARLSCSCTRTSGVWVVLVTQAERNTGAAWE